MTILRKVLEIPYCIRYSKLGLQGVNKNGIPKQHHQILSLLASSFRTSVYTSMSTGDHSAVPGDSMFTAIKKEAKWIFSEKSKMQHAAFILYDSCADEIDFTSYFKKFELPDTFVSWFLLTELHVWMCIIRVMVEGKHGIFMRNKIVEAMWIDVTERVKKLGKIPSSVRRDALTELNQHFQAALFAYDEGLLGEDKVLAAALWRNLFCSNCKNSEYLETFVQYVRMQVSNLDSQSYESFCINGKPNWLPLKDINVQSS